LLALRSQAQRALGASSEAEQDRAAAASLLKELAGCIPDADLRRAFLTQPQAVELTREET
jgi:hypothetical protein